MKETYYIFSNQYVDSYKFGETTLNQLRTAGLVIGNTATTDFVITIEILTIKKI